MSRDIRPGCPDTSQKRMKGFEPSTFAMARRRSSQLSYIRVRAPFYPRRAAHVQDAPATPATHDAVPMAGRSPAGLAQPLNAERPLSPKGSSRSRTASWKPASAALLWKANPSAVWRAIPSNTVPISWVAWRPCA